MQAKVPNQSRCSRGAGRIRKSLSRSNLTADDSKGMFAVIGLLSASSSSCRYVGIDIGGTGVEVANGEVRFSTADAGFNVDLFALDCLALEISIGLSDC